MTPKLAPGVFHGTRRLAREIAGLTLTEYHFAPNCAISRHCHEQSYLSLVLDGGWSESYAGKVRERKPLTLTVHPAGELHSERLGAKGARAFHIEFSADWLRRLGGYSQILDRSTQIDGGPPTWLALRLHAEFRKADLHSALIVEGLILESIGDLARQEHAPAAANTSPWLARARDILHARFAEPLTLEAIARDVGVHPVHLARTFRRRYRCSVGEYLRQLRVQLACRELASSDRPLAEIAIAAGFVDQSHLGRTVRHFTGMSPGAFRRTARAR